MLFFSTLHDYRLLPAVSVLTRSFVFTVCEHEYMNTPPPPPLYHNQTKRKDTGIGYRFNI